MSEVFGRLNGEWKVGVDESGRAIVYTGVQGVDGWQLVCRPNHVRDGSQTEVAMMIAAAPDMWMALRGALRVLTGWDGHSTDPDDGDTEVVVAIKEALRKADCGSRFYETT
jgi:hypothetical protein